MTALKLAHVFLAILTFGSNLSYPLWRAMGERDPQHLAFVIRGIKWIDRHVTNPAYLLLFVTGGALALLLELPLTRAWLWLGVGLYVVALGLGYFVYAPVVRRELAALERGGVRDPDYRRWRARSNALGVVTSMIVLTILVLMVMKPF